MRRQAVVGELGLYPVKSLRGLGVDSAQVRPWGFDGDRHWMVVDPEDRTGSGRYHRAVRLAFERARSRSVADVSTATVRTERLRELVTSVEAPELPSLSEELVCALDLPQDMPDELDIARVAEVTGTSAHTLRYYERVGLMRVGRSAAGHRVYDRDALARVVFVCRLRDSDMSIETIRRYVDLVDQGEHTAPERLALMQEHRVTVRRRLQELQVALAVIDYKITTYGGHCAP